MCIASPKASRHFCNLPVLTNRTGSIYLTWDSCPCLLAASFSQIAVGEAKLTWPANNSRVSADGFCSGCWSPDVVHCSPQKLPSAPQSGQGLHPLLFTATAQVSALSLVLASGHPSTILSIVKSLLLFHAQSPCSTIPPHPLSYQQRHQYQEPRMSLDVRELVVQTAAAMVISKGCS